MIFLLIYTSLQFLNFLDLRLKYNKYALYCLQNIGKLIIYSMQNHQNITYTKNCKLLLIYKTIQIYLKHIKI